MPGGLCWLEQDLSEPAIPEMPLPLRPVKMCFPFQWPQSFAKDCDLEVSDADFGSHFPYSFYFFHPSIKVLPFAR